MPDRNTTVTLSSDELNTIAWALSSLVLERRSRGVGVPLDREFPAPSSADECCAFHKAQYDDRLRQHTALRLHLAHTSALSDKMALLADQDQGDPSDSPVINALHQALLDRGDEQAAQRLLQNEQEIWDQKIGPLLDELTIPD